MESQQNEAADLAQYTSVSDCFDRCGGPFFETRSSLDWFMKRNRRQLIEADALITREGRSGSLLSIERFPKVVIQILKRGPLEKVAS